MSQIKREATTKVGSSKESFDAKEMKKPNQLTHKIGGFVGGKHAGHRARFLLPELH